jgi:hypothetical protein
MLSKKENFAQKPKVSRIQPIQHSQPKSEFFPLTFAKKAIFFSFNFFFLCLLNLYVCSSAKCIYTHIFSTVRNRKDGVSFIVSSETQLDQIWSI